MFSGWAYTPDRYVLCNYETSSEHAIISRCCTIKYGGGAAHNLKERPLVSGVKIYLTNFPLTYNCAGCSSETRRVLPGPRWV